MFALPWLRRRCLNSVPRPIIRQYLRKASTGVADGSHLPPALLLRARKIAAEHSELADALEDNFDTKTAKRMGDLAGVASALKDWDAARDSLEELRALVRSGDKEMREMAEDELRTTTADLEGLTKKLSVALTPKDPYADLPCYMEFRPGPGGLEGRFFMDSLVHMYKAYCARKGLRCQVVSYVVSDSDSGAGGERALQEAILEIQEAGAYDTFRGEAGMHRVQRVPVTESKGRTHTSAVAVWVLPSFPETGEAAGEEDFNNPASDFYIDPTEVKLEKMRASGAGGQHVNKTESAIRLTHVPTGIVVSMQEDRSQQRNREAAWKILRSRLASHRREEREEEAQNLRDSVLSQDRITRGDKIRTYNYSQDRCTDHRSGLTVSNLPNVIEGGEFLDKIFASVRDWLTAQDVHALIAAEEKEAAAAAGGPGAAKTEGKGKKR